MCSLAGILALRDRRCKVTQEDFAQSKKEIVYKKNLPAEMFS